MSSLVKFRLFLRYPTLVFGLLREGKHGTLRSLIDIVGKKLSQTELIEIENCLRMSLESNDLVCPHSLRLLNGDEYLWRIIIYYLCRLAKPRIVIETGVLAGLSTSLILQALKDNNSGTLYSIDIGIVDRGYKTAGGDVHVDKYVKRELGWLVPEDLKKNWQLLIGDSKTLLPDLLNKLKSVDIFLHDSEHTYETMMFEYSTVWKYLSKEGYLRSDDIRWNSAWRDFTNSINEYARTNSIIGKTGILNLGIVRKI